MKMRENVKEKKNKESVKRKRKRNPFSVFFIYTHIKIILCLDFSPYIDSILKHHPIIYLMCSLLLAKDYYPEIGKDMGFIDEMFFSR